MTVLVPLDSTELDALGDRYYRGRWVYLQHAARILRDLAPKTVLEVGPGPHRFVPGSETMDIDPRYAPTFIHDAGETPWPCTEAFDVVVGLQSWEHLGGHQRAAFAAALACGRHVLLSLPYRWVQASPAHRGIDDETIARWTLARAPLERVHVTRPRGRERVLLLFQGEAC